MRMQKRVEARKGFDSLSLASQVYEALDTPKSLACYLMLKYNEHDQLATAKVCPSDYTDHASFFSDLQSVKLLAKYPYLKTTRDRRAVALKKFLAAEEQCRLTNERLREASCCNSSVASVIFRAQRKIASILGPVPSYESLDFRFGPGASFGTRGDTSVYRKVDVTALQSTYDLSAELGDFLAEFPGWIENPATVELVQGSELTFVPKDAKTDRPICIEPLLNGLYQLGVGSHLKKRLLRFGIDLRDQTINQKLAGSAQRLGLATVDFESASDTISFNTVLELLPIDWFEFLNIARCSRYRLENSWFNFQKFSSMGNGYTFELETLIFYAIAKACAEELDVPTCEGEDIHVYGDDVILPSALYDLFCEVTKYLGFTVNTEKSFTRGVFYESCGADYFDGTEVRPFFFKRKVDNITGAFYAHNTIRSIREKACRPGKGHETGVYSRRYNSLTRICDRIVRTVPEHHRCFGPAHLGDAFFHAGQDTILASASAKRHKFWCGWVLKGFVEKPFIVRKDEWPRAYALYHAQFLGGDADPASAGYAIRNRSRPQKITIFVPTSVGLEL